MNVEIHRTFDQSTEWVVEASDVDGDGGLEITLFAGRDAQRRASEYAEWRYRQAAAKAA